MTVGNQHGCILLFLFLMLAVISMLLANLTCSQAQELALPGEITTTIRLREDGAAEWILETRFRLETTTDRVAFEDYISNFSSSKTAYLAELEARMTRIAAKAETITGRSMKIQNLEASALQLSMLNKEYGVIRYSFCWIGFAALNKDQMRIGDVFEGGYYLSKDEALVISMPRSMRVISVEPSGEKSEGESLMWLGPRNFAPGEPRIVLAKKNVLGLLFLSLAAFAASSLLLAWVWTKRRSEHPGSTNEELAMEMAGGTEEMILELVREKGKVSQSSIVKATGLSKSKVSSVLSELEKKHLVRRSRLGREKVVQLQDPRDEVKGNKREPLKGASLEPRRRTPTEVLGVSKDVSRGIHTLSDLPDGLIVLVKGPMEEIERFALQRVERVLRAGARAAVVLQDAESTAKEQHTQFLPGLLLANANYGQRLNIVTSRRGRAGLEAAISRAMLQRPKVIVVDALEPFTQMPGSEESLEVLLNNLRKASDLDITCLWLLNAADGEIFDPPRLETIFDAVLEIGAEESDQEPRWRWTARILESMQPG